MIRSSILKVTTISLILMMGVISCGDNSTGSDPGEPPEIPEITAAQPDFSYFSQAQKIKASSELQDGEAYNNASTIAFTAQGLFAFSEFYTYFGMAENEEPEYEDGKWVWSYNFSYNGETIEFKLTGDVNESANEINWAYYLTYTGGEEEFIDYKYMEGTTSLDGNSGSWQINDFENSSTTSPLMTYEWSTDSDGNLTSTFNFPDDDSISSIVYVQNGEEHTLTMTNNSEVLEIFWDSEEDHGYWWDKSSGDKLCWTSDKSNIACNDIGL